MDMSVLLSQPKTAALSRAQTIIRKRFHEKPPPPGRQFCTKFNKQENKNVCDRTGGRQFFFFIFGSDFFNFLGR
jgi:hypothetical protein